MVAFYKHDIVAWRKGTAPLSDRAYRVYHVIVEQIMQNEGDLPYHEKSLAGLSNRSVRDFKLAFAELVALDLVQMDGRYIRNRRAETELQAIESNRRNAAKGGRLKRTRGALDGSPPESRAREFAESAATAAREAAEKSGNINGVNGVSQAPLAGGGKPKRPREDIDAELEDDRASASPEPRPRRKKGRRLEESQLAADAQPAEAQARLAEAAGLDNAAFRFHWQAFRSYFVQREEWRADWVATWANWLKKIRPSEKRMGPGGGAPPFPHGARDRRGDAQDFIAGKLAEHFGRPPFRRPEPPDPLTPSGALIDH